MAERKLAGHVTVGGVTYGPTDDLPDDVIELLKDRDVWSSDSESNALAARQDAYRRRGTSTGHKLATYVTIGGQTYGPGDPLPDDVAARITNPDVWEGGELPDLNKPDQVETATAPKAEAETKAEPEREDTEPDADDDQTAGAKPTRGHRSRAR